MRIISKLKVAYNQLDTVITQIHHKTGKGKLGLFFDIILCMLKYGASPNNYSYFEFYNLSGKLRNTYTTNRTSQKMIHKFNNLADIDIFENKLIFAEKFYDLYCRDYLNAETMTLSDFEKFCSGKSKFILKPCGGAQGQDIKVYYLNNNVNEIYKEIKEDFCKGYIIEEWIEQHPVLSDIFPDAVNC